MAGEGVTVESAKPASDTQAELTVTAAASAATGFRELRALGDEGFSNLRLIRVDDLEPVLEVEPNDAPGQAQPIKPGIAVDAILKDKEYDHYQIELKAGDRVVFEVEAQRLGQAITPVLTLFGPNGQALAQATQTRGLEQDARLALVAPASGVYRVEVRDTLFAGGERAGYRLRVTGAPIATAVFPLAVARGGQASLEASGGGLSAPRVRAVDVAKDAPRWLSAGVFEGPEGAVGVPMRLLVTDSGAEVLENSTTARPEGMPLEMGGHVNGRISRPAEVDRYRVAVQKGKPIQVRVRASEMGSWLDSVLRAVDDTGNVQNENDDAGVNQPGDVSPFNAQAPATPDSRLELNPQADGEVVVEIYDRYGAGGPEYGYRLEVGSSEPDFQISLLFGDPNLGRRRVIGQQAQAPRGPGANGAINLKPGTSVPLNFVISSDGSIGKIQVRADGLPEGVTAAPVNITLPVAPRGRARNQAATGGALVLKVAPSASGKMGALRVVATAKVEPAGSEIVRQATARILLDPAAAQGSAAAGRLVIRELDTLPIWVAGRTPTSSPASATGAAPVAIREAVIPGVLLQGGSLDIPLVLEPELPAAGSFELSAQALDAGVVAQTLVAESGTPAGPPATVRVIANTDAPAGVARVRVLLKSGGVENEREIPVIVRAPARIIVPSGPFDVDPRTGQCRLLVGIEREAKFQGPIVLKVVAPEGVGVVEQEPLEARGPAFGLRLTGIPIAKTGESRAVAVEIQAQARMPRGLVRVGSEKRSIFRAPAADESDDTTSNNRARADVKPEGGL